MFGVTSTFDACSGNTFSYLGFTLKWAAVAASTLLATAVLADPEDPWEGGSWGQVLPWPHIAVSMANLPDGRVLTWSGSERETWPAMEQTYSATWDPATGEFIEVFHEGHNMFCSHLSLTENGEVFVNGGRNEFNSPWTSLFNYENNEWHQIENMATGGRWYPVTLTLPSGEIMTNMGTASNFRNPEKWSLENSWEVLNGIDYDAMRTTRYGSVNARRWWANLTVTPQGEVFHFWDSTANHLINTDGVGNYRDANAISDNTDHAPGVNVQFAEGKLLVAGNNQGTWNSGSSDKAFVIDLNGTAPTITTTGNMNHPRMFANLVTLPTGEVLVVGGNTSAISFSDEGSVLAVEIWNPETGIWREGAAMDIPRNYHSTALLLTDGRVLAAGSGYNTSQTGAYNHEDGQVYSPPYLFDTNGAPAIRPSITAAPGYWVHGDVVEISASANVDRFTMVRLGSTTHAVNTDTRFHEVPFTETSAGQYQLTPTNNPNLLIAGYWMIFAIDAAGVPSEAQVVRVQREPTPEPWRYVRLTALSAEDGGTLASVAELGVLDENGTAISSSGWTASAGSGDELAALAIDGNPNTHWQSADILQPHDLIIDLGEGHQITGISYLPRADGGAGQIADYEVRLSTDGINWSGVFAAGTFANNVTTLAENIFFAESISLTEVAMVSSSVTAPDTEVSFSVTPGPHLEYQWSFGDGTPLTPVSSVPTASHTFTSPGRYNIVVTVHDLLTNRERTFNAIQIIHAPLTANAPAVSTPILFDAATNSVWTVNPDNDSVTVIDADMNSVLAEVATDDEPVSLARAANGDIWVVNKSAASITVFDGVMLNLKGSLAMPPSSHPHGIAMRPGTSEAAGEAYVVMEASGEVLRIDVETGATLASAYLGPNPRHISITADGQHVFVSRYITPALPNEATAEPVVEASDVYFGGEVLKLDADSLGIQNTIVLRHSDRPVFEAGGPGLPNYLGPAVISPDGLSAWVPSKQDNILAGGLRDGRNLVFDQTVRAITSKIDLQGNAEDFSYRIDHDNSGVASHAVFDPYGILLFTALETSREVAISDAATATEIIRLDVGFAPQGLTISPDGNSLYVHNFMSRSVSVFDISNITNSSGINAIPVATIDTVGTEALTPEMLRGKQLFYDARDPRLALDSYMSCASCHHEGRQDGRVWDFTGVGEGLRNTIGLNGKAGMRDGFLHWSANFDELQDFEEQIRSFALGSGLMSNADFFTGTRSESLGDPKAGVSDDLDALATYITSLARSPNSPYREANGSLSADANAGLLIFERENCLACHIMPHFTDSTDETNLHDVGTIKQPTSGGRMGGTLIGIDTPSLKGTWDTAPYLHDGSAQSIEEAIAAHQGVVLDSSELSLLASFVLELDERNYAGPAEIEVEIDVTPWSVDNAFAPDSDLPVTVAIFGSEELNVNQINISSLRFGRAENPQGRAIPAGLSYEVSDGDQYADTSFDFYMADTGITCDDTDPVDVTLTGDSLTGDTIIGYDSITPLACETAACHP